jgi:phage protein D
MFVLTSKITIGGYVFEHVHNLKILRSRRTLVDVAEIRMPNNYEGRYLASIIRAGDPVEIMLGYDGELFTEFTGFVSEIQPRTPVVIKCEDQMYELKRRNPEAVSWKQVTLREVLAYLVPEGTIQAPQLTLSPFYIKKDMSVAKALQKIQESFGLDVYYRGGVVYAGLAYMDPVATSMDPVIYDLQLNVITPQLTYRRADDVLIKVKAISLLSDNKKIETSVGDPDGELRTLHFYNVTSANELKGMAEEKLDSLKYDGYQGSLLTFGIPRCDHGQVARLQNDKYGARDGSYFIDAVTITFGVSGYRREVYIGKKAA